MGGFRYLCGKGREARAWNKRGGEKKKVRFLLVVKLASVFAG